MGELDPFGDISTAKGKCVDCLRKQEGEEYVRRRQQIKYEAEVAEESNSEVRVVAHPRKGKPKKGS